MTVHARSRNLGFNLLEVLVAMVIVMVGLLGLAALQARAHVAELESYQRAQALVLLYDMMDRLNNNRYTASCFAFTTDPANGKPYAGTAGSDHMATPACAVSSTAYNTLANSSLTAWDSLLTGAAETSGGTQVGAMVGARGCVSYNAATEFIDAHTGLNISGTGEYTIAVSWQGMSDTFAPTVSCGNNLYGAETRRRTVWATTRLGTLIAR